MPPKRTFSDPGLSKPSGSDDIFSINKYNDNNYGHSWATTGNLTHQRNVKWNQGVRVVLIPTREEYRKAKLGGALLINILKISFEKLFV